ncbi:MAG: hypothetical protein ABEJ34_02685 [Haloferacaceae archaeon]
MRRTTLVGAVLAVLVVASGAVAATPGDAGTDDRAAAGPPADLPGPVPDFVTEILDTIRSFLSGGGDGSPGPAVSDVAGNGGG